MSKTFWMMSYCIFKKRCQIDYFLSKSLVSCDIIAKNGPHVKG